MNAEGEAVDGLDDVYLPEPEHALAQAKEFAAWHHPRKQFVRIRQWCSEVRKLIPQLGLAKGDPFRYLTLPGNELLDVRALHGVVEALGVKMRYLGFNSVGHDTPAQAELALSQSEVLALSSIDEFSAVLEEKLEAVTNDLSPACIRTKQEGPFHAINLDLCDSIAFREIGHTKGSPLEATGKLLELQLQSASPWLLFITTRAEPSLIGAFARKGFDKALDANMCASEDFRAKLSALISGDLDQLDEDLAGAWANQDPTFLRVFCTGLGKWLLSILVSAAPPRELALLSSCFYQSGHNGPDMLSLAFLCGAPKQAVNDPFAILPPAAPAALVSEVTVAIQLTEKIGEMFDLDAHLAADATLQDKLIGQAGRLMAQARYGQAEYEAWARSKFG